MLFSSTLFLFAFLPIVFTLYFLLPGVRTRNALLLLASLVFYAWGETTFVLILMCSIGMNFILGRFIGASSQSRSERRVLTLAIVLNLALLGFFKYANFLVDNLNLVLQSVDSPQIELAPVHLPIGISFFTFQAITYIVDIHRREASAQSDPWRVGLYIALFPQLIAGPIVRYKEIAQALTQRRIRLEDCAEGVRIFIVGLAKKVLVADALAAVSDKVFSIPTSELETPVAWLGLLCFSFQIYFDFSGYSDMAIGLGRAFGFRFPKNFDWPYTSKSLREFWRRWHITLSTFFRDYLYIPLGGNRRGAARTALNLLMVFVLCGLWHGANWTFVLWGLIHGVFLALERTRFGDWLEVSPTLAQRAYVLAVVGLAWVFFRSPDIAHGWTYLSAMFGLTDPAVGAFPLALYLDAHLVTVLSVAALSVTDWPKRIWQSRNSLEIGTNQALEWARSAALITVLILCTMSLAAGTHTPFIYFRF